MYFSYLQHNLESSGCLNVNYSLRCILIVFDSELFFCVCCWPSAQLGPLERQTVSAFTVSSIHDYFMEVYGGLRYLPSRCPSNDWAFLSILMS